MRMTRVSSQQTIGNSMYRIKKPINYIYMPIDFLHVPVIFNFFKVPAPVHKNLWLAPASQNSRYGWSHKLISVSQIHAWAGLVSHGKSLLGNHRLGLQLQFDLPKNQNFVLLIQYTLSGKYGPEKRHNRVEIKVLVFERMQTSMWHNTVLSVTCCPTFTLHPWTSPSDEALTTCWKHGSNINQCPNF